jgi:hypothetical protein
METWIYMKECTSYTMKIENYTIELSGSIMVTTHFVLLLEAFKMMLTATKMEKEICIVGLTYFNIFIKYNKLWKTGNDMLLANSKWKMGSV